MTSRALAADFHADDTLVPALDHLAAAEEKSERHAAIAGAVEFRPFALGRGRVIKPPGVVHEHGLSGQRFRSSSLFYIDFLKVCHGGTQIARSWGSGWPATGSPSLARTRRRRRARERNRRSPIQDARPCGRTNQGNGWPWEHALECGTTVATRAASGSGHSSGGPQAFLPSPTNCSINAGSRFAAAASRSAR